MILRFVDIDDIPKLPKKDKRRDDFMNYDSGNLNNDRIMVFSCGSKIKIVEKYKVFIVYCTFSSVNATFFNFYLFMPSAWHKPFGILYSFKKQRTNNLQKNLSLPKEKLQIIPSICIIGFEKGLFGSISPVFNTADYILPFPFMSIFMLKITKI